MEFFISHEEPFPGAKFTLAITGLRVPISLTESIKQATQTASTKRELNLIESITRQTLFFSNHRHHLNLSLIHI